MTDQTQHRAEAPEPLTWTPHPLLPVPDGPTLKRWASTPDGVAKLADYYTKREQLIRLESEEPLTYGTEPEHWKDADELLALDLMILMIFGGNRAGKSEYAAKRLVRDAIDYNESVIFAMHENATASVGLQQKLIWKYLPPEIRKLNGKGNAVFKVKYSVANGFTDGKIVLPNRTEIYFLTYGQTPGDFEGMEVGAKFARGRVSVWADENLPLPWLNMLKLRMASRNGKLLWTYTPVNGITPTIKELLGGSAKTVRSRFAELLPDRVNVPGLPVGHMPYIVEPYFAKSRAIYFHSILNPFGNHYSAIVSLAQGKPSEYIERRAYGYSRDLAQRLFPYFGEWNIVKHEHLPATGTNYMFTDPAGGRNWATLWVRVTPGNPPKFYIYRDWPSEQRFGEWAVPTERETTAGARRGWDGDPGPAQNSLGYGVMQYKQLFLREESWCVGVPQGDPYRVAMAGKTVSGDVAKTVSGSVSEPVSGTKTVSGSVSEPVSERDGAHSPTHPLTHLPTYPLTGLPTHSLTTTETATLSETIHDRYIDSRAAKNQHTADKGGTCLADEMAQPQYEAGTKTVLAPPMRFRMASGVDIDEGVMQVNELLFWNREQPMMPVLNEPRLYVSAECRQVIWALQNYTGLSGETGASKDFIDLVRYLALGRLTYIPPGGLKTAGGGTY